MSTAFSALVSEAQPRATDEEWLIERAATDVLASGELYQRHLSQAYRYLRTREPTCPEAATLRNDSMQELDALLQRRPQSPTNAPGLRRRFELADRARFASSGTSSPDNHAIREYISLY